MSDVTVSDKTIVNLIENVKKEERARCIAAVEAECNKPMHQDGSSFSASRVRNVGLYIVNRIKDSDWQPGDKT